MKPEEKAALTAGGATALVAGAVAATMATPVAWAAVLYGAYRMGKVAYKAAKDQKVSPTRDTDLFI